MRPPKNDMEGLMKKKKEESRPPNPNNHAACWYTIHIIRVVQAMVTVHAPWQPKREGRPARATSLSVSQGMTRWFRAAPNSVPAMRNSCRQAAHG